MLCSPDSYEMNMPPVNPDNSSLPLMVTFNLDINRQTKLQKVAFLFEDSFPSNIPWSALRTWWWQTWSLGSWWGSTFNGKIAGYIFRKLDHASEMIIHGVCHCQKALPSYSFWSLIVFASWSQAAVQQHQRGPVPKRRRPWKARKALASYNKVFIIMCWPRLTKR